MVQEIKKAYFSPEKQLIELIEQTGVTHAE